MLRVASSSVNSLSRSSNVDLANENGSRVIDIIKKCVKMSEMQILSSKFEIKTYFKNENIDVHVYL